jgi:hypothetical protein
MSDPMTTDDEYVMRNEETTAALDVRRLERSAEAQGDALARRLDKLDDAQRRWAREIEEESAASISAGRGYPGRRRQTPPRHRSSRNDKHARGRDSEPYDGAHHDGIGR